MSKDANMGYRSHPSWIAYRDLLVQEFQIKIERDPAEIWLDAGGHTLHVDEWRPDGAAKGTAILVHGGGGHGRILAPLGDAVAAMGWRAVAPDLPGYGLTRTKPGWRWDYAEWPRTVAALADRADGPVVLLGLSVGGMTALFAAQQATAVKGVIATTLIDMSDPDIYAGAARWRWLGHLARLSGAYMPMISDRIAMPLRLAAPLRAMSSSPAMRRYFQTDPLLGSKWIPARFWRTLHEYCPARGAIDLPCRLLLAHPGADAWTPVPLSRPAFDRIRSPKRLRVLTNGSHLPAERPAFDELRGEIEGFLGAIGRHGPPFG
jgi:alpha-beta hydrolase superfamily lysophospholipase